MGWDRTAPTKAKYSTAQHRRTRKQYADQLERDGYLMCTAKVCLMDDRIITNPNGRDRDGLHAGHADNGTDYDGPQHNACNVTDGAKRGRAKQTAQPTRRWEL